MRLQQFEQRFHLRFVERQQKFDVAFIKVNSLPIKLPVKRGQRVQFQNNQPFHRHRRNFQFRKAMLGGESFRNQFGIPG